MRPLLAFIAVLPGALAQCIIEGRVTDGVSGAAIAKVHLYANSAAAGFPPAILTRTDANGTFCLEKLDPGAYSLIAQRAGYLDAVYKSSRFSAGPSSLTVAPGKALSPLTITMTPRPILTGLVVDIDGNPAINVEVSATETQGAGIRRSPGNLTLTDAKGRFRFYDLDPGSYFLVASPAARVSFFSGNYRGSNGEPLGSRPVETFYPAATRSADATSIELKAGSEVTGITITMQTTLLRHVSGKVIGAFRGYLMLNTDLPNGHSEGMAVQMNKDGTFRREGLRPVKYTLKIPGGNDKVLDLTNGDMDNVTIEIPER